MPVISFVKKIQSIEIQEGTLLMQALLDHKRPVASSCDGDGVCAKCKIIVTEGLQNLTPENETEIFLKDSNNILQKNIRISCQTKVLGDITVDATYW